MGGSLNSLLILLAMSWKSLALLPWIAPFSFWVFYVLITYCRFCFMLNSVLYMLLLNSKYWVASCSCYFFAFNTYLKLVITIVDNNILIHTNNLQGKIYFIQKKRIISGILCRCIYHQPSLWSSFWKPQVLVILWYILQNLC